MLPLFARLSSAEQHRIFAAHTGRRIVLATNVAETSLTVPGIRYVVDPGTARISRYSQRLKVQRLPIEPVSQASANQRKGRCGRTSRRHLHPAVLGSSTSIGRPEFTDPEILRTNLASVILQMTTLDLGDIEAFRFVEPPDRRSIHDGVALLQELGAFEPGHEADSSTPLGRSARPAAASTRGWAGWCSRPRPTAVSARSSSSRPRCPFRTPANGRWTSSRRPARSTPGSAIPTRTSSPSSTCGTTCRNASSALSSSQFRRLCRTDFLNYLRVREWQDLDSQLRQVVKTMGITLNEQPADPTRLHQSLLAGLLSHLGLKDLEKPEYIGARGARFSVFPGSTLFRKNPSG